MAGMGLLDCSRRGRCSTGAICTQYTLGTTTQQLQDMETFTAFDDRGNLAILQVRRCINE
ncbi:hypothetical protein D3C75_1360560 [compost metagenome]